MSEVTDDDRRKAEEWARDMPPLMSQEDCYIAGLAAGRAEQREELADVKRGYDRLDANWDHLNNVNVGAFRNVLNMPDASIPEMVKVISDTKADRDRMRELVSSLTSRIEAQSELLRA